MKRVIVSQQNVTGQPGNKSEQDGMESKQKLFTVHCENPEEKVTVTMQPGGRVRISVYTEDWVETGDINLRGY
jgi:hypothetical protein